MAKGLRSKTLRRSKRELRNTIYEPSELQRIKRLARNDIVDQKSDFPGAKSEHGLFDAYGLSPRESNFRTNKPRKSKSLNFSKNK
jgi:hypothetical protein